MASRVEEVLEEALQLSRVEQLALIQRLSESLHSETDDSVEQSSPAGNDRVPCSVKRTEPATDLADYAANFWPDDESIDDFNAYIRQQRAADRLSDQ